MKEKEERSVKGTDSEKEEQHDEKRELSILKDRKVEE